MDSFVYGLGYLPLHHACQRNCIKTVKRLIDAGANVDARNYVDGTPLHIACSNNCVLIVEHLLDAGAFVNPINMFHETPLHIVAEKGFVEILRILLKKGADVCAKDKYGITPLTAVIRNHSRYDSNECVKKALYMILDWEFFMNQDSFNWGYILNNLVKLGSWTKDIVNNWIIKLDCANLLPNYVFPDLGEEIISSDFFQRSGPIICKLERLTAVLEIVIWSLACYIEFHKTKTTIFGGFSLCDLIFYQCNPRYVANTEIQQAILSSDLETQFPIYSSLLQAKFTKDIKRQGLLVSAVERFKKLLEWSETVGGINMPNEILECILLLVDNKDLENVIKA